MDHPVNPSDPNNPGGPHSNSSIPPPVLHHVYGVAQSRMGDEDEEHQGGAVGSPHTSGSSPEYTGQQGGASCEELEKNLDEVCGVLESENGAFQQRMWGCFQNCARAVAQVYMTSRSQSSPPAQDTPQPPPPPQEESPPPSRSPQPNTPAKSPHVEESFRSAAQHATSLYKDSIETSRRLIDLAIKTGSNRRTKEILSFVKSKKKRFIKREELISFLVGGCGKKESGVSRKVHGGGGGGVGCGVFDVAYSHLLHHVHSGGGFNFPGVGITQQQSQQQLQPQPLPPLQLPQPQQQQSTSPHLRLSDPTPYATPSSHSLPPRKHMSADFHASSSAPQRLLLSNNGSFEDNDPSSMLHLAVQQLFVAGGVGGGGNEFVHLAGVKRPAGGDDRDGSKTGGEDDEEDCMMEDSVDGGNECFKRMRFY